MHTQRATKSHPGKSEFSTHVCTDEFFHKNEKILNAILSYEKFLLSRQEQHVRRKLSSQSVKLFVVTARLDVILTLLV